MASPHSTERRVHGSTVRKAPRMAELLFRLRWHRNNNSLRGERKLGAPPRVRASPALSLGPLVGFQKVRAAPPAVNAGYVEQKCEVTKSRRGRKFRACSSFHPHHYLQISNLAKVPQGKVGCLFRASISGSRWESPSAPIKPISSSWPSPSLPKRF